MVKTVLNGSLYYLFRLNEPVGLNRIRGGVHLVDGLSGYDGAQNSIAKSADRIPLRHILIENNLIKN